MKKTLAVLLVVCVVCSAAAAFAQGHQRMSRHLEGRERVNQQQERRCPEFAPRGPRGDFRNGSCGGCYGRRGNRAFAPDMTQEIRAKVVELEKLRIDLDEAMTSRPINRTKALETYGKMQKLESEVEAWRFGQRLDNIEEFIKMQESKPEAPKAPEPEAK